MGIDATARTTTAVNDETNAIRVIDAEESEQKKKNLLIGQKSISYISLQLERQD